MKRFRSENWALWSFDDGLQTLPDTIAHHLRQSASNVDVRTETRCTQLQFTPDNVKVDVSQK